MTQNQTTTPSHNPLRQTHRPLTREEVIATRGIEARCFYRVWVGPHLAPAAPWPRVPIGPDGEALVAAEVARRRRRLRF
jgi:hypothetical protein